MKNYRTNGYIRCDIAEVEKEIINAHLPIESCFKFLCHACHVAYDSKPEAKKTDYRSIKTHNENKEFKKINRIKLWAKRTHQDNHKIIRAYLFLEKEGEVSYSILKKLCTDKEKYPQFYVKNFASHYSSMKTDSGNNHGKVFYDQDGIVKIWSRVREEIRNHFGE